MADGDAKQTARVHARARLSKLSAEGCREASALICAHLGGVIECRAGRCVVAFAPISGEPDIRPWVREALGRGVHVALPHVDWVARSMVPREVRSIDKGLEAGRHGVPGPAGDLPQVSMAQIDTILVPGLAFDSQGGRLGRGGGFYDRFLARVPPGALLVGVCFEVQVLDRVPREAHDRPVHVVVTERRVIDARSPGV